MPLVPPPFDLLFVIAVGLVLGSFLNVCIHRLPLGESVVTPRSRCPRCSALIRWYDNVPVLSFLLLRARCRHCGAPISWRYPLVETLAALTLGLSYWHFGPSGSFAISAAFTLAMIVLFFTDWDHQLLPDAVTLTGFALGVAVAWFNPFLGPERGTSRLWTALAGAAVGAGALWAVGAIYGRLRGVEAMGMGDVKMMAMVGAFAGPVGVLVTIFAASTSGAIAGLLLIPLRGGSLQDKLPFGCFLAPAGLVALLYGHAAAEAYFDLLLRL